MRCFVHRHQIHFDDTMTYGSHHFLTTLRFQCAAREALLFRADTGGTGLTHLFPDVWTRSRTKPAARPA
ncbi:MAG TPA: hypothetical protein VKE74_02430 [Gemmataceae bacterium]|nr:hypothetical protein [Gemmataceae bacterium]